VLKLFNDTPRTVTIYPILENFTGSDGGEGGTPEFYPVDEDPYGTAMAQWITAEGVGEPMTLQPNERANFSFAINVPADAQPGGHYGALILSTSPPDQIATEGVGVSAQVGVLIFVRVSGEVREAGSIAEFGFKNPKVWYNHLPIDFFLRFENSGNTHLRPTGNLFIKNWFGRQVASIALNSDFRAILPRSVRRFDFGWGDKAEDSGDFLAQLSREWKHFAIGKYEATVALNYGSEGKVVVEKRAFSVWPWRLMLVGGTGLVVILLLLGLLLKLYNLSVIKRYEKLKARGKS
jgi:hypothetical protein